MWFWGFTASDIPTFFSTDRIYDNSSFIKNSISNMFFLLQTTIHFENIAGESGFMPSSPDSREDTDEDGSLL